MDLMSMIKPKRDDDYFKFAERGDLEGFLAAVPDSVKNGPAKQGKPSGDNGGSSGSTLKRLTILQKATDGLAGLLKKDFDVNAQNETSHTLLHVAALNGHALFVEKLVTLGAETLAKDATGNTPLHLATWSGHPAVVQVLLKYGSQFNEMNHEGSTPLHFAAQYGKDKECAQLLLATGANPMLRNRNNETPLDLAARFGKTEIAQLLSTPTLLQQIYRKNERPKSSPLHLAARSGYKDICSLLLEAGVNIDCPNAEGATALHEATQFGKRDVVLLLLQAGANPKVTNDVTQTPLELLNAFNAKAQGNVIQQLLQAAMNGADKAKLAEIATSASTGAAEEKAKAKSSKTKARAVIAYAGSAYDPSVLSFEIGDIIYVDEQSASGWWKGTLEKNGLSGDFKANYVEVISDKSNEPEEPATAKPVAAAATSAEPAKDREPQPEPEPEPEPGVQKRYPAKHMGFGYGVTADALQNHSRSKSDGSDMSDSIELMITAETTVEQWLLSLKLERYLTNFIHKGYVQLRDVRLMDAAQLESIGIQLAGHRKKLLMAIEKIPYFPVSAETRALRAKSSAALDDLLNEMGGGDLATLASIPPATTAVTATPPPAQTAAAFATLPPPLVPPVSPQTTPAASPAPFSFKNLPKPPPPVVVSPTSVATPEVAKPALTPVATPKLDPNVSFDDLDGMMAELEAEIGDI